MFEAKFFRVLFFPLVTALIGVLATYYFIGNQPVQLPNQNLNTALERGDSTIIIEVDVPIGKGLALQGENWCNCTWGAPVVPLFSSCPGFRYFNWSGSTATPDIRRLSITKPASCASVAQTVTLILSTNGSTVTCYIGSDTPWACLTNNNNFCLIDDQVTYDDPLNGMFFSIGCGTTGIPPNNVQVVGFQCSSTYQISVERRGSCGSGG